MAGIRGVGPRSSDRQSDVLADKRYAHMELDGRAARPIGDYKAPVLLVKLIQHMYAHGAEAFRRTNLAPHPGLEPGKPD